MAKQKFKTMATAPTLERLRKHISDYFGGSTITFGAGTTGMSIATGRGILPHHMVVLTTTRVGYRWIRIES